MSIESDIAYAWSDATERLFMKFDDLQTNYGLDDNIMLRKVSEWCGFDVQDEYFNWIEEGKE